MLVFFFFNMVLRSKLRSSCSHLEHLLTEPPLSLFTLSQALPVFLPPDLQSAVASTMRTFISEFTVSLSCSWSSSFPSTEATRHLKLCALFLFSGCPASELDLNGQEWPWRYQKSLKGAYPKGKIGNGKSPPEMPFSASCYEQWQDTSRLWWPWRHCRAWRVST